MARLAMSPVHINKTIMASLIEIKALLEEIKAKLAEKDEESVKRGPGRPPKQDSN